MTEQFNPAITGYRLIFTKLPKFITDTAEAMGEPSASLQKIVETHDNPLTAVSNVPDDRTRVTKRKSMSRRDRRILRRAANRFHHGGVVIEVWLSKEGSIVELTTSDYNVYHVIGGNMVPWLKFWEFKEGPVRDWYKSWMNYIDHVYTGGSC
jgi:hypothetical protein